MEYPYLHVIDRMEQPTLIFATSCKGDAKDLGNADCILEEKFIKVSQTEEEHVIYN